ncbi:MAG: hypothetical protein N7Q72_00505 [Spiroplasma sp. Tabriz.8]|nr:hypothetical protein [Spiroplasma sp. Tabriz.8]
MSNIQTHLLFPFLYLFLFSLSLSLSLSLSQARLDPITRCPSFCILIPFLFRETRAHFLITHFTTCQLQTPWSSLFLSLSLSLSLSL